MSGPASWSAAERRLLEELQRDLPLVRRPFALLGERSGMAEPEVLAAVARWIDGGLIREISVLLEPRRLGYHTTLAAVQAPPAEVDAIAASVSRHPGVSHNYLRDHRWNLWFTLALPRGREFEAEVLRLLASAGPPAFMILPAGRTYKLRVRLGFAGGAPGSAPGGQEAAAAGHGGREPRGGPRPLRLSARQRRVLLALQEPLPVVAEPWREVAAGLGLSLTQLLRTVERLKEAGVIRRLAAVLHHRQAGFSGNGMACFRLQEAELDRAGVKLARLEAVSHCYRRPARPGWPYNLYAMVHARSRAECRETVEAMAGSVGCGDYQLLHSLKEYKKERVRYLEEWQWEA